MQATYKSKASLSTNQNRSQPRQAIVSRNMNPIQNRTSDATGAMRSTIQSRYAATYGLLPPISVVLKGIRSSIISTIRMLVMKLTSDPEKHVISGVIPLSLSDHYMPYTIIRTSTVISTATNSFRNDKTFVPTVFKYLY